MSTPEASKFSKHYTLEEARALLPQVKGWLARLDSHHAKLQTAEERLAVLLATHADLGGEKVNTILRSYVDMRDILQEIRLAPDSDKRR